MQLSHPELLAEFTRWWRQNLAGGWGTRWRRRRVWIAQVIQRLGYEREVTAPLFFGSRMRVVTNEDNSKGYLAFGYGETALTALMLHVVKPGDAVIDVGTHFAYEAMLAARLVGPTGYVLAFEPNPASFRMAQLNLAPFRQAEVRQAAVGDRAGHIRIESRQLRDSGLNQVTDSPGEGIDVPMVTLDEAWQGQSRRVSFIKMDIEGAEETALRGADRLLREHRPWVVLEAEMPSPECQVGERAYRLAEIMKGYGYSAHSFEFNGQLQYGQLGEFPVGHANIAFQPPAA